MMNMKLACVGKLKDGFYVDASEEYKKRLSRFCGVEIAEVPDEKAPDSLSAAEIARVKNREGERLLGRIRDNEYVIALCVEGKELDSVAFAGRLRALAEEGKFPLTFVIGGSLGLGENVLERANERLSLSKMTLPHRLCRVFLLEQIYRAYKINAGETYHK